MVSQERVKAALSGTPKTVDTLQAETGLSGGDVLAALAMLEIMGEAQEVGGRWKKKAAPRAKVRKGKTGVKARVRTSEVIQKKGFAVRRGGGLGKAEPYPIQVCSTRYKDPETGKWAKTPRAARAAGSETGNRAKVRKGRTGAMIMTRRRATETGEIVDARVMMGDARASHRRGKLTKKQLKQMELDVSRDALEYYNPGAAAELHSVRMREAHNSDKGKRAAVSRKKNAAARAADEAAGRRRVRKPKAAPRAKPSAKPTTKRARPGAARRVTVRARVAG